MRLGRALLTKHTTYPHDVVSLMVDEDMSIFKAWRTYKKLTQAQVAETMGVAQSAVARIESGKHEPSFSTLKAYASAIGVLPEQLDLGDWQWPLLLWRTMR